MKVVFKVSDQITVEAEGKNAADTFNNLAVAQEVFQHTKCGCCGSTIFRFVVRTTGDDEYEYHELHCANLKCRARLSFGHKKKPEGGLYPKRRWDQLGKKKGSNGMSEQDTRAKQKAHADAHHGYLPKNGWYIMDDLTLPEKSE